MPKCHYYDICGFSDDADPAAGLCILHSRNPEKDRQAFMDALDAHTKKNGNDFREIVFLDVHFFSFETFTETVDFSGATFIGNTDFIKTTFAKGANFGGTTFNEGTTFYGANFNERAYFYNATFIKDATFNCAKFADEAYFGETTFIDAVHFNETTFAQQAYFGGAKFGKLADFLQASFANEAIFCGAAFLDEAWFEGLTFNGQANFGSANFSKGVSFARGTFKENSRFGLVKFFDEANFAKVQFMADADFSGSTFTKGVAFSDAILIKANSFNGTAFQEHANFSRTTFNDSTDFGRAEFMKGANFSLATFNERSSFSKATFSGGTDFQQTMFKGQFVDFSYSVFKGRTVFSARVEREATIPIFSWFALDLRDVAMPSWERKYFDEALDNTGGIINNVVVDFREVVIDPPDAVSFQEANLRRCLFQGTDLRKVEMTGVFWPRIGNRVGVFDEFAPLEGGVRRSWSRIERLYRDIRQSYEDRKDYIRAGDFHYGEMEMRRRNPTTNDGIRILLLFYRLIGGYGERCLRPLIWLAILIVVATFSYLWLGIVPKDGTTPLALTNIGDWLQTSYYSLRVMTVQKPDDYVPIGHAKGFNVVLSVFGPILLSGLGSLFAFAIKQRLKR